MADKSDLNDALAQTTRIMERLTRMPHKPHKPAVPKGKTRSASKGRVRKGNSKA